MNKLLITGFDPFDGQNVNPAWEAVQRLPDRIGETMIFKKMIPTVFGVAAETVLREAERVCPDTILCVGQAGGRADVTPEYVGINLRNARIPDNQGNCPSMERIVPDGPDGLFVTVPAASMVQAMAEKYPAKLSYTAGTFVCNDTLYTLLYHYRNTSVRVGFIHVPFLPEQAVNGEASMPLETICDALKTAIEQL